MQLSFLPSLQLSCKLGGAIELCTCSINLKNLIKKGDMQKGSVDEGATPAAAALKGVHFLLGASHHDHGRGGAGDSSGGSQTPTDAAAAAMLQGRDSKL